MTDFLKRAVFGKLLGHRFEARLFQPLFRVAIGGEGVGDEFPVAFGMVHFPAVHEFVDDEVIDDLGRGLNEAPVERDGATGGTGAPAGFLRADRNAVDLDAVAVGELPGAWGQFPFGEAAEVAQHDLAVVGEFAGQGKAFIGKGEFDPAVRVGHAEDDFPTAKRKPGAVGPRKTCPVSAAPEGRLFEEPRFAAFEKTEGFGLGATTGNDKAGGAVGLESKQIAARAGVADEMDSDAVLPGQRLFRCGRGWARRWKAI